MTKEQLRKNWRRGFAVALTAAMVANSIVPSATFAAEFTSPDGITEAVPENTANDQTSDQTAAFGDGDSLTDTEDFSTGETDTNSAQAGGTETSEAVKALQERINALPTVEEFQAMADGTTVEDSTLNQKQMDVYNEAQAIADALDQLSEEEQGQVDTSKLEALFEYFNSMTEETASNVISPTSSVCNITSGGTYTVEGGTYSGQIQIKTTSAVTLNIEGNITATGEAFIYVGAACSNLIINGNGKTINGVQILNNTNSSATVTLNNCVFKSSSSATVGNVGTIYVKSGSYSRTGSSGQIFSNADGTLYIQGGTITNVEGTNDAVAAGNVYMSGGTVSAPKGGGIRLSQSGTKAEITGGTISGSKYGVYLKSGNPTCKIVNVTFSGNTNDVYLASGHTFTLSTDYAGANNIKVGVADSIGNNTKRQITTTGTAQSMLAKVSSVNSAYTVNYDTSGKYLYLWKHTHTWSYSASGNTVTAKCTSDQKCGYYSTGLTATISATDKSYSGKAYDGVSVTNNITSVTGAIPSAIKYVGRDGTTYPESTTAPTNTGKYTASVTIDGQTAKADFEITKAQVAVPDADSRKFVYNGTEQTYTVADSSLYTVTGNTQTDAGTYTVTVSLKDKTNSEWADGTTADLEYTFTIEKAESAVSGTPAHPVENLTYTGKDQTLVSADDITGGTIYYRVGEDGTWQKTLPTGVDAGEYEIFYYVKGDANHKDKGSEEQPMGSCKATIAKKKITVVVGGFKGVYEESVSHSVEVKVTDPAEGYKITYSTTGKEGSFKEENPVFTEVGNYTVYYRVEAGNNYEVAEGSVTGMITGASFDEGDITAYGYEGTYDGASHKISVETKGTAAGATITYSTTGEADSYTDDAPGFKDATDGTKTVYYKVSKKGYQDVTGSVEVSIARKNVTATVSVKEKEYDGTTNADVEASVDTGIKNETLTVSGVTGTFDGKDAGEGIAVSVNSGTMTVTAGKGTKAENYNVSCEEKASGKITARPVTVEIVANGGTYGDVKGTEATLKGTVAEDQVPVILKYTGKANDGTEVNDSAKVPSLAGKYTVTAAISDKNYELTGVSTAEFVIGKATLTPPTVEAKEYNGTKQTAEVPVKDNLYAVKANDGGTKAGTYNVILTLTDPANYQWENSESADTEVKFEIVKTKLNKWETEPSVENWTYGDAPKTPAASAEYGNVTVEYRSANGKEYSETVPTQAGNYKVRFTVAETEDYNGLSVEKDLTIAPKAATVTVKDASKTYGEADPEAFEYEVSGVINGDILKDITVSRVSGEDAGTYDITATQKKDANPNYEITFKKGTFTINPKEIGIQWGNTAFTYNGTEQKPQATATGLINEDTCDITVSGAQINANVKDASGKYGTYKATASKVSNANYKLPESGVNCSFIIYPKKLTSSMVTSKEVYGYTGSVIIPEIAANDTVNEEECTLVNGTDYTVSEATGKEVGTYQVNVTGKGNYEGIVKVSYKIVDTKAPTGSVKIGNTEWTEKNSPVEKISFTSDRAYRNSQTFTITAKDEEGGSGIEKISYFLTANTSAMRKETLAALSDTKWTELKGSTITLNPGSKYVIYVKITDKSGNTSYLSSDGIIVDSKAPVITGITNNRRYCSDVSFTVTDDVQLKSVTVDEKAVQPDKNGTYTISAGEKETGHTVVAEDMAGNKTAYKITLNANGKHSWKTDSSTDKNGWKVTTPATCEATGTKSRTCKDCGFTETQNIAALGHEIDLTKEPRFVWTAEKAEETDKDGIIIIGTYTAKAVFQCSRDAKHTIEKECEVTPNIINSTDGKTSTICYDATVTVAGKVFTDRKEIKLDKKKVDDSKDSNIYTATNVAPGAPETNIDGLDKDLAESLMTEEEKANYQDDSVKTDITVYLDVQDINGTVSADETAKAENELNDIVTEQKNTSADLEIQTGINYVGLSMFKNVKTEKKQGEITVSSSDKTTQISETGEDVTIELTLSDEELKAEPGFTRSFYMVRIHNGVAERLETERKGNILRFKTSKFSTYAIVHVDVKDNTPSSPVTPSYPVTDVVMAQEKATLTKEGETLQLTAAVKPSYADNKNLTWKSSDEKIATVDKNGKVTAVANGTVTITATSADGKHTATATITVKIAPEKLTVTADKKTLTKIGDSLQITAKVEPDNAYKKLIWKSSDEKIAIVDSDGKVTAVGTGTATITATTEDGKLTESVTITVKIPDEPTVNETTGYGRLKARSVTQTNNSIKLEWTRVSGADGYIIYGNYCNGNGKSYKYNKITTITNGKTRTWTHTKLKKATYYKYIVKAYKLVNGKKVITDTSVSVHATTTGGKYGVAKAVSITKIGNKKSVTKVTLKKGKTAQITAKEIRKDKTIKHHRNICYESSNTKVAAVTPDGTIQATGKGTCTIWVYAQNGVYKAVTVTVK